MKKTKGAETVQPEVNNPPADAMDWSQYGGATGFEGTTAEDLGIPFLIIVQKGSPEIDPTHKDHEFKKIDDAKLGSIVNTLTREVLYSPKDDPLLFVPCFYQRLYVEWKPKNAGGGIVRSHSDSAILNSCHRDDKNRDILPNGNIIATTSYMFGFYLSDEGPVRAIIGFTSTQLKKARAWLNMASAIKVPGPNGAKITPPLFSHKYALTTTPENNDKGSWMGWALAVAGPNQNPALIQDCVEVARKAISDSNRLIANASAPAGDEPPM